MENVYTLNREAIIDVFSVWLDSYLLSPPDDTGASEFFIHKFTQEDFTRIHEQLQKED